MLKLLPGGYEQLDDNTMRVWVEIPPRRNGDPNAIAAMQALAVASRVNAGAYDPQEVPLAGEQIALADGHTATGAGLLDHTTAAALMEYQKRASSGCANGACESEEMDE